MNPTEERFREGLHSLADPVEPSVDLDAVTRAGERLKHVRRTRWSLATAAGLVAGALVIVPQFAAAPIPAVPAPATTTSPPDPPASAGPTPTPPTPSPAALRELACADAYTTEPRGAQPTFTSSGVGFVGLSEEGYDPLRTEDAGFPLDEGGYVTKAHLYLEKGVTWADVTVLHGDLTLAWVPAGVWTGLNGPSIWSIATYEAHAVRFESCQGSYTGFLGAVRSPTDRECVTLGVRSNLHPEVEPVRVAIGEGACR